MKKTMLVLAVLAMVAMITTSAGATLLFSDDFSGSGPVAGTNGWAINTGAGPDKVGGEALWQQGSDGAQMDLSRNIGAQSSGTLNGYFDVKFNYNEPTFDAGTNMNIIKFFSSTGAEVWRLRCWSGQYPAGVQTTNIDDIKHNSAVIGQFAMNTPVSFFISWNLTAKTYSLSVNGVQKVVNDTSYFGTGWSDISKFTWTAFNYKNQNGFTVAESSMDNVAFYLNETRPVPEPSSFMALGMFGLGALGFIKRRR
jgi:hypothetical protein